MQFVYAAVWGLIEKPLHILTYSSGIVQLITFIFINILDIMKISLQY